MKKQRLAGSRVASYTQHVRCLVCHSPSDPGRCPDSTVRLASAQPPRVTCAGGPVTCAGRPVTSSAVSCFVLLTFALHSTFTSFAVFLFSRKEDRMPMGRTSQNNSQFAARGRQGMYMVGWGHQRAITLLSSICRYKLFPGVVSCTTSVIFSLSLNDQNDHNQPELQGRCHSLAKISLEKQETHFVGARYFIEDL